MSLHGHFCHGCGEHISDKDILDVSGKSWHSFCLVCSVCATPLEFDESCFWKMDKLYCRAHYYQEYGYSCASCGRPVFPEDWVRRAEALVFHLACFSCIKCKRQLSTGEQFGIVDEKIHCSMHYIEQTEDADSNVHENSEPRKTKRLRTTFSEAQVEVLQLSFKVDTNPDSAELERLSSVTNLTRRVIQVWFQNSRARQKRHAYNNSPSPAYNPTSPSTYSNCE